MGPIVDETQIVDTTTTTDPIIDTAEPAEPTIIDETTEPEPTAETNTRIVEEDIDVSKLDPFQGQVAYTLVALTSLAGIALEMFRYRSPADFYTSSDTVYGNMNWWKMSHLI